MTSISCQAGILDPPPEHVLAVALAFQVSGSAATAALTALQRVIRRELSADIDQIDADSNPAVPTTDTGELGVTTGYPTTNLTITLGISLSGFSALGVSGANLPADLFAVPWGAFGETAENSSQGDVVLQICADSAYVAEHVLRRIEHTLGGDFSVTWTLSGEQRNGGRHSGQPLTHGVARSLIGFLDGLSNLDPSNPTDQKLIFTTQPNAPAFPPTPPAGPQPVATPDQPGYNPNGPTPPNFPSTLRPPPAAEPAWATNGSYLFIRATVFDTAAWDQLTLQTQQQQVGRFKYSGATLDSPNDIADQADAPTFAATPANTQVPLNSHIRRSNPRSQQSEQLRRIFRRGYPLILPSTTGTLQRGLIFIAFARSLSTQVDFIMKAWLKNPDFPTPGTGIDPLLQNEVQAQNGGSQVLAGGYYFVPPVSNSEQPWNWILPSGA